MINHARTLLRNMSPSWPSDEYVPPEFQPGPTPDVVAKIKRILWGRTPCSEHRVRQLMQLLHATELEEHVLQYDPRVTYLPFDTLHFGKGDVSVAEFVATLEDELADHELEDLFGDIAREPNKIFYNLWQDHDQLPYKFGGLVLAMIDATERAR